MTASLFTLPCFPPYHFKLSRPNPPLLAMKIPSVLISGLMVAVGQAMPQDQAPLLPSPVRPANTIETGVGHFSEWSRATKRQFLVDWQAGRSSEWTIVQGNEGGDLDSMTAARKSAQKSGRCSTSGRSHPCRDSAAPGKNHRMEKSGLMNSNVTFFESPMHLLKHSI